MATRKAPTASIRPPAAMANIAIMLMLLTAPPPSPGAPARRPAGARPPPGSAALQRRPACGPPSRRAWLQGWRRSVPRSPGHHRPHQIGHLTHSEQALAAIPPDKVGGPLERFVQTVLAEQEGGGLVAVVIPMPDPHAVLGVLVAMVVAGVVTPVWTLTRLVRQQVRGEVALEGGGHRNLFVSAAITGPQPQAPRLPHGGRLERAGRAVIPERLAVLGPQPQRRSVRQRVHGFPFWASAPLPAPRCLEVPLLSDDSSVDHGARLRFGREVPP